MELIYITPNTYPAKRADDFYTREMARGFNQVLGEKFKLIVATNTSDELNGIRHDSVKISENRNDHRLKFYVKYFLWIYRNLLSKNLDQSVFYVGDINIALMLFFFRFIFNKKYKIVTDWHLYFKTWKYRFVARHSDRLITTSKRLKQNLVKVYGVHRDKISEVYGGVDIEKFKSISQDIAELRKELGLPQDKILIGYVGLFKTMGMEKGVGIMIESLQNISNQNVNVALVGGKKHEIDFYRELAKKLGVEKNVIFIETVSNDLVPKYEMSMDVLVIPYPNKPHFSECGFPMKVYEYMASKKPVIYSRLELIDEVLSQCALSFTPDDSKDLAQVISGSIENSEISKKLTLNAFEKVKQYTWSEKAKNIVGAILS